MTVKISSLGSSPLVVPITLTGVTLTTVSSYALSGTVQGVPNTITVTTAGAHGLAALLSACTNLAASGGTNSGAAWSAYDWTKGTPGSAAAGLQSYPNSARVNQLPGFPWLAMCITADATTPIAQGTWLIDSVPSSTTFTFHCSANQYAQFGVGTAGPALAPVVIPGPGEYFAQLGANTVLYRGATTDAAGTAKANGLYVPGAINGYVTGAAIATFTPGSIVPFFNSGVPLGGTVTALAVATGAATTVAVPLFTDGTVWQIGLLGAGTTTLYKIG
jgi:hypothetical protein